MIVFDPLMLSHRSRRDSNGVQYAPLNQPHQAFGMGCHTSPKFVFGMGCSTTLMFSELWGVVRAQKLDFQIS